MAGILSTIFISYAHADNLDGWVDAFNSSLQYWFGVNGVKAEIWRDRKLGGADVFSDEILDQLKRSALLVSILSPNGMASNWCEKERQRFEQYAGSTGGFRIGNAVRALKVVMTPADGDAHRPIFGTIGYEFFEKDPQSGRYDHYLPSEDRFKKKVDRLAQEIKEILPAVAAASAQPSRPAVYVAEVTSDLDPDRTKVVDQLSAWNYRVTPSSALPINSPALRASVELALAESVLSVHLLSDKRGAIPEGEDRSMPAIQYELANARGLDRVVWVLPGVQPHPSVEAVIASGAAPGMERVEGPTITIEDLKEILAAKLKSLDERVRRTAGPETKQNVYVVCDSRDRDRALNLKSFLDGSGFCAWLPPGGVSDRRELDRDHRETLKMSDAVIIYWGAADVIWFRGKLRDLTAMRTRRNRPFAAEALYVTSPPLSEKSEYRTHLDLVVEQPNGFDAKALLPLLNRLRGAKGAAL